MPVDVQALAQLFARVPFPHPTDAPEFLLWRVAHRYQRDIDRACASVGLTHLQFITLLLSGWLGRTGAVVTQAELVAASGIVGRSSPRTMQSPGISSDSTPLVSFV